MEIVELLISKGARVHDKNNEDAAPLHIASDRGHLKVVELLLSRGASVHDLHNKNATPLYIASQHDYIDIIRLLLSKGASIQHRLTDGSTCSSATTSEEARYILKHWVVTIILIVLALCSRRSRP